MTFKAFVFSRRDLLPVLAGLRGLAATTLLMAALAQGILLPSWNDGTAKQAILAFVTATTAEGTPTFAPQGARIATFDQGGTLWMEHPVWLNWSAFLTARIR